ncbi:MAG: hypothetical protein AB1690_13140 [Candidatus Zixiibacteriota bacterium]
MMKQRLILSLFLLLSISPLHAGESLEFPPGKMAVVITVPRLPENLEYNSDNFMECLASHLDYYLWLKGFQFDIFPSEAKLTLNDPETISKFGDYDYLLQLTPKPKFRRVKIKSSSPAVIEYTAVIELRTDFFRLDSSVYLIKGKKSSARPLENWVATDDSLLLRKGLGHVEPPDFVLKRLLSEALSFLPRLPPVKESYKRSRPLKLLIDSRIANDIKGNMEKDLLRGVDYVARSLWRQFKVGLHPAAVEYFTVKELSYTDIERLLRSFIRGGLPPSDTLTVAVFRPDNSEDYYIGDGNIQVGLSDLGRKLAVIAEISPPHTGLREWKVFLEGQLLLHEIGHLLGAVHVSDLSSIMTIRPTWLSSDRFDRLNDRIIRAGLEDGDALNKITSYLMLVLKSVEESEYPLAELPSTFFSYINLNHKELMINRLAETTLGAATLAASDGYRAYLMKDFIGARDRFSRALAENPNQASFHYYLAQVSTGPEAFLHLNQAAALGYYSALHELVLKRK